MIKQIINFFKKFKYIYAGQMTEGYLFHYDNEKEFVREITYNLLVNGFGKRKIHVSIESHFVKSYIYKSDVYRRAIFPWLKGASIHSSWFCYRANTIMPEHNVNINGRTTGEQFDREDVIPQEPSPPKEAKVINHPHLTLIDCEKDDDTDDFTT